MRNLLLTIILSAGTLLPAAELSDAEWAGRPLRFRAVADLADKTGVLYLDDAVLAAGPLLERDEPPTICWGDLSGGTGGATVLKSVRIAAFD